MTTADDGATNVVKFERPQRKQEPPELRFVEVRLNDADCSLVMSCCDEAGDVVVLKYTLASAPPDFDLDRLRGAWEQWRGSSTAAS